jgi:hypothetical protein
MSSRSSLLARALAGPQYAHRTFRADVAAADVDPRLLSLLTGIRTDRAVELIAAAISAPRPRVAWWYLKGHVGTLALLILAKADGMGWARLVRAPVEHGSPGTSSTSATPLERRMVVTRVRVTTPGQTVHLAYDRDGRVCFPIQEHDRSVWFTPPGPDYSASGVVRTTLAHLMRGAHASGEPRWIAQESLAAVTMVAELLADEVAGRTGARTLRADAVVRGLADDPSLVARATRAALITLHALGGVVVAGPDDGSLTVTAVPGAGEGVVEVLIGADGSFMPQIADAA